MAGAKDVLNLVPDPKNAAAYNDAAKEVGHSAVIHGVMLPGKDLKALVPLQVSQVN